MKTWLRTHLRSRTAVAVGVIIVAVALVVGATVAGVAGRGGNEASARVASPDTSGSSTTFAATTSTTERFTTTTMELPTTTTASTTTTTLPPVTAPPMMAVSGTVQFLDQVTFAGSIDGQPEYPPPAHGTACSGRDGYADLAAGATVIVASASGTVLATAELSGGTTVNEIKGTESERLAREDLIDAIYELRVAYANGDAVRVAQLNLDRANQRVADLDAGGTPPFEGHAFNATWCHLSFTTPPLPVQGAYKVTVTHRGTTTFSATQVRGGQVALVVG